MKNLATALLKAQKNMGVALKDAKNPFYKSKYADLNSVIDASIGVLNDAGIVVLQPVVVIDGKQYVETKLIHADSGESQSSFTEVIVKSPNDAQQAGAGITYARRFGLQALVVLKAEDDDGNFASGKTQSITVQKEDIKTAVTSAASTTGASLSINTTATAATNAAPPKFKLTKPSATKVSDI